MAHYETRRFVTNQFQSGGKGRGLIAASDRKQGEEAETDHSNSRCVRKSEPGPASAPLRRGRHASNTCEVRYYNCTVTARLRVSRGGRGEVTVETKSPPVQSYSYKGNICPSKDRDVVDSASPPGFVKNTLSYSTAGSRCLDVAAVMSRRCAAVGDKARVRKPAVGTTTRAGTKDEGTFSQVTRATIVLKHLAAIRATN
ncbi:hypothetical protein J6590_032801 [Homalodisca vitripennis]|nr:hypothetical protein J6590_032801 [Homalodisca vitripennis]